MLILTRSKTLPPPRHVTSKRPLPQINLPFLHHIWAAARFWRFASPVWPCSELFCWAGLGTDDLRYVQLSGMLIRWSSSRLNPDPSQLDATSQSKSTFHPRDTTSNSSSS